MISSILTLFGRIVLGHFVIITDKISLIMQVYQQSFCYGKECGRRKRIGNYDNFHDSLQDNGKV